VRNLIDVERRYKTAARRAGVFRELEGAIRRCFYDSEEDATTKARDRSQKLDAIRTSVLERSTAEPAPAAKARAAAALQGGLFESWNDGPEDEANP